MYCGECGKKIESGSLFCGECGAKVIQEDSPATLESTVKENTKKNKKPMSKLQKILLVSVLVLFVVLFTTYQVLNSYYSPENVAEDYFSAIADKDMDRLYQYLNLEGDTTFASKEIFKNSSDLLETEEIQNYTVNDAVYDEGKLSARVTVYYMLEGNSSESSTVITLTKEKEKKLLFFDSWVISNNQGGLVAKDYSITVPKGSKVLIDDISLESKYLDKEFKTFV